MSVTYTVIANGYEDRKITIEAETTVGEAIKKINLILGEDVGNNEASSEDKNKGKQKASKIKFMVSENDQSDHQENQQELIEIFGLSAYTDRSEKFNTIKFPNNELIIYPIPLDNLFLKSIPRGEFDSK